MKMDFPQVDLPTEVLAWTNVTEDILNIYKQSCRLQACIVAICTEGSMKASINLLDYEIRPNDLITLLPGTIIQFRERTEKVCLCFAGFSAHCAGRINLMKNIGNAYPKLIEQPVVPLNEEVASYPVSYTHLDVYKRQGKHRCRCAWFGIYRRTEICFHHLCRFTGCVVDYHSGNVCYLG